MILLFSAVRFVIRTARDAETRAPGRGVSFAVGGGIGLLSGLTGTGGGIFLTPLLIALRWARTKTASATSAVFILVNSASGLAGNLSATKAFPSMVATFALASIAGGALGSYLGSRRFDELLIKRLLAMVLAIAGAKMLIS